MFHTLYYYSYYITKKSRVFDNVIIIILGNTWNVKIKTLYDVYSNNLNDSGQCRILKI